MFGFLSSESPAVIEPVFSTSGTTVDLIVVIDFYSGPTPDNHANLFKYALHTMGHTAPKVMHRQLHGTNLVPCAGDGLALLL